MYWEDSANDTAVPLSGLSRLTMAAMIAGIVFLGVYPEPVLKALRRHDRVVLTSAR
jgi:NADH:ubiquinone oxidoreductase subunit 4 (subunit M)